MSSWTEDLANGIKNAATRKGTVRIAVHSEAQIELGKSAAGRMCPQKADEITFELIPANEQDIYPAGVILVP